VFSHFAAQDMPCEEESYGVNTNNAVQIDPQFLASPKPATKRLKSSHRTADHATSPACAEVQRQVELLHRLKREFLTFIAHELRTPLNTLTAIELLDPTDDPRLQADMLAILRRGYDRLEKFIETALTYFRWQAGEEEGLVDRAAISDLVRVVRSAAANVPGLSTSERELLLALPDAPCLVYGREQHLTTVVHILLENAVKFSPDEQPIAARIHAAAAHAVLTVTDQGQGFAPELAAVLFQPFTIGEVMHHAHGTGLHLALADAIVTAYGGHIWACSPGVGHGATFTVEWPAVAGERRPAF
jgi:signal transduction histidine kinase